MTSEAITKPPEHRPDPYFLEIEIDGLPPANSAAALHWKTRRRHRKQWELRTWVATTGRRPPAPLSRARITITRCSSVESDYDNLAQGGKFLLDALTNLRIIEDDSPRVIGHPAYAWEYAAPRFGKVRIRVEAGDGVEIGGRVQSIGREDFA